LISNTEEMLRAGRGALLDLLANLLLREVDAQQAAILARDPALTEALHPPQSDQELRELRVAYTRLFLVEVPPYASLFLEAPPVVGGETSRTWEAFLAARGRPLASLERAAAADHAGLYVQALAAAERTRDVPAVLPQALSWLPQFLTTLQRNDGEGFYGRVAALTALALQESARAISPTTIPACAPPPDPEDDSLRVLARWLSTPAWSGWFLTKSRIHQLAAHFGASIGLQEREHMLEQAFEASALDEQTAFLLDALLAEQQKWQEALNEWQETLGSWREAVAGWKVTLQQTHTLLLTMRKALA
jgi:TorA maturation chaperone TorD